MWSIQRTATSACGRGGCRPPADAIKSVTRHNPQPAATLSYASSSAFGARSLGGDCRPCLFWLNVGTVQPARCGAGLQYRVAVIISFDNDPSATESEHSFATDLLYFLAERVSLCPVRPVPPGGGS